MGDRTDLQAEMIEALLAASGQKVPTSAARRLGRTALTMLGTGRMMRRMRKNPDADVDLAKVAKLVTSIGRLKGLTMKMGQIMSYIDVALPEELREALVVLQTHAQPMTFEQVQGLITQELGDPAPTLLAEMEPTPLSAASIGQVHRSRLPDGTVVAVKVQYPEIAKAIQNEFGPAAVGTRLASLIYPHARFDDFVKEARSRFLEECDYRHEAHCQAIFVRIYEGHPVLMVPAVHEAYCARRVLTTTFVQGQEFEPFLATDPSQAQRDRLGEALFEFYLGSLFRHLIYNCDPHPGNYLFRPDGRIAMLDHGCTRQFDEPFVARLAHLTRAVHRDDRDALHAALVDFGIVREGKKYDYDTIRSFLRSFYGPMLQDERGPVDLGAAMEVRQVVSAKRKLAQFALPGEFLFLFRIRFGLMSVLARLGTQANWYRLERKYVDEFTAAHPLLRS